jgi:type IV secretion system protein VirB5
VAAVTQLPPRDADPYAEARGVYNDRYADLAAGKRNWQIATLGAAALCGLSLTANIIQGRQVKQLPYVVLADRTGYAITVPEPLTPSATSINIESIERYEVAAFVRAARTVDTDMTGEDALLKYVKAHARGAADHFLGDYFESNNPHIAGRDHSTSVTIVSLIPVGPHSFQVRWTEMHFDRQGHRFLGDVPEHWVALLKTEVHPGADVLTNPAGVYVVALSWTPEDASEVQR